MNERSKKLMNKQQQSIFDDLKSTFSLPVFEDDLTEDEFPADFNYFLVVYGDFRKTESEKHLVQEVYVVYVTEDNPNVETNTLDIITVIKNIKGVVFERTVKERLQKEDTDSFVDQVTCIFSRRVVIECTL